MSQSPHAACRQPPVWLSPTEWSALERFVHELRRAFIDLATGIYLDTGIRISPLVLSQRDFDTLAQMERGVAVAIQHEGVDL